MKKKSMELGRDIAAISGMLENTRKVFLALIRTTQINPQETEDICLTLLRRVDGDLVELVAATLAEIYTEEELEQLLLAYRTFPILCNAERLSLYIPLLNERLEALFEKLEGEEGFKI